MSTQFNRLKEALAARYVLEEEIGAGGMATVYRAEDVRHRRTVAVKVLDPELAATVGAGRFSREIETAAKLHHPHILPLYDSGEADGFLFYVMPYVDGESLRDRLNREGQLPLDVARRIAWEVADGLAYAHDQDVVHRDIKPGNIMLSRDHALIADFGIARAITRAGVDDATQPGISSGTPTYMSPEQAGGEEHIDGRADIYALGCVLFEMLTGEPPFTGKTAAAILARKSVDAVPSLQAMRPTVPPRIAEAVEKALARAPADRFTSGAEFKAAIDATSDMSAPRSRNAVSIWQVLGVYVLGSWLVLQVIDTLADALNLPDWAGSLAIFLLIVGLPIVLATAITQGASAGEADVAPAADESPDGDGARGLLTWRNALLGGFTAFALWGAISAGWLIFGGGNGIGSGSLDTPAGELDANLVAVLPFRVSGADPDLAYLREGMVDLLDYTLTGESGPRAADTRTVISRWKRAVGDPDEDLSDEDSRELARSMGTGLVLLGGVVGSPENVIMNASLIDTRDGETIARARVEGSADSLNSLGEQLTAQLLVTQAFGGQAEAAHLPRTSLPVMRAYLEGQVLYRQGRFADAAELFEDALEMDSTFAPAAVRLFLSAGWAGPFSGAQTQLAGRLARAGYDALSQTDRAVFLAYAGPLEQQHSASGQAGAVPPPELIEFVRTQLDVAPTSPEILHHYGDLYYHNTFLYALESGLDAAQAAFARTVALDSSFAPALEHLMDVAARRGDLEDLITASAYYLRHHSDADNADYYRWRTAFALGDSAGSDEVRSRLDGVTSGSLWRILGYSQAEDVGLEIAPLAAAAIRSRLASPALAARSARYLALYALNAGRPTDFERDRVGAQSWETVDSFRMPASRFWALSHAAGAAEAQRLSSLIEADGTVELASQDLCRLAHWYVREGDPLRAEAVLDQLRVRNRDRLSTPVAHLCVSSLDALIGVETGETSLEEAITALEEVVETSAQQPAKMPFILEISRLRELNGDLDGAIAALDRRHIGWTGFALAYLSYSLREKGRLAVLAGRPEVAIDAYSHYLRLRPDPAPELAEEVAGVQAELERLEAEVEAGAL